MTQPPCHEQLSPTAVRRHLRGDVQSENLPLAVNPKPRYRRQSCNPVPPRASRQSHFHTTQSPLVVLARLPQSNQPIHFLGQLLHGVKRQTLMTRQSCTPSPQGPRQREARLHRDLVNQSSRSIESHHLSFF